MTAGEDERGLGAELVSDLRQQPRRPASSPRAVASAFSASAPSASAIARRLTDSDSLSTLQLTHICDRRAREKRARQPEPSPAGLVWTDRFDDLLASDVDIIVEAVVGAEPAVDYVRAALLAGKSVVTANKQVIAHHGPALLTLAERQGRQLRFEAAVGGAMPIVRALDGLAGERVTRDRRDPERHHQCRAVEAWTRPAATSTRRSPTRARAAMRRPIRRPISTAAMPPPSSRSSARSPSASASRPAHIETRTTGERRPDDFRKRGSAGGTIRQIARAEFDRDRSGLTAWVAPIVRAGSVGLRAHDRTRRMPRSLPARMRARSR